MDEELTPINEENSSQISAIIAKENPKTLLSKFNFQS